MYEGDIFVMCFHRNSINRTVVSGVTFSSYQNERAWWESLHALRIKCT